MIAHFVDGPEAGKEMYVLALTPRIIVPVMEQVNAGLTFSAVRSTITQHIYELRRTFTNLYGVQCATYALMRPAHTGAAQLMPQSQPMPQPQSPSTKHCECGAHTLDSKSNAHSTWCPLFE